MTVVTLLWDGSSFNEENIEVLDPGDDVASCYSRSDVMIRRVQWWFDNRIVVYLVKKEDCIELFPSRTT